MKVLLAGGFGTRLSEETDILSSFVYENFALLPSWITRKFDLDHPSAKTFLYADVASRGQVGQSNYPWGKLDELEKFQALKM